MTVNIQGGSGRDIGLDMGRNNIDQSERERETERDTQRETEKLGLYDGNEVGH